MIRKRHNHAGVTIVELMVYIAIASFMGLLMAKYLDIPNQLKTMTAAMTGEDAGYLATSIPVNDLKMAESTSIQWPLIDTAQANPPYNPASNSKFMPWFQVYDPTIALPELPLSYICYAYRESDQSLVRMYIPGGPPAVSPIESCNPVHDDFAQERVIVKNVLPPTAEAPLFSKDPAAVNMVIVTLRFPGPKGNVSTISRRIHVRT